MNADEILELVRSRSSPGVLILDLKGKPLYVNEETLALIGSIKAIPPEVRRLCRDVAKRAGNSCALLWDREGEFPYSLRALPIGAGEKGGPPTHVMVLVEKITEQHGLNLKKARVTFGLTGREIEVVTLVAEGLANKEIGARLFLSEHTIKDHLKNIMRKMGAASRSEIAHLLK